MIKLPQMDVMDLVRLFTGKTVLGTEVDNKRDLIIFTLESDEKITVDYMAVYADMDIRVRMVVDGIVESRRPDVRHLLRLADEFVGDALDNTTSAKVHGAAMAYAKERKLREFT